MRNIATIRTLTCSPCPLHYWRIGTVVASIARFRGVS
jgi:hypothetical protein